MGSNAHQCPTGTEHVAHQAPSLPPGIVHWYGRATGSWWAMIPGRRGPFLVEAVSADALASAVHSYLRRAAW